MNEIQRGYVYLKLNFNAQKDFPVMRSLRKRHPEGKRSNKIVNQLLLFFVKKNKNGKTDEMLNISSSERKWYFIVMLILKSNFKIQKPEKNIYTSLTGT